MNHAILNNLQDVFNLLPNLSNPTATPLEGAETKSTENTELARAMSVKTNDQLMAIYLSSLIRAITAFHDLIENKIQNRQQQEEKESKKDEVKDTKESKDPKDPKDSKDPKDPKDSRESKGDKDPKDTKNSLDANDSKESNGI